MKFFVFLAPGLVAATGSFGSVDVGDAWTQPSATAKIPAKQSRVETSESDSNRPAQGAAIEPPDAAPEMPQVPESAGWEAEFAWGLYFSKKACIAGESFAGPWASDRKGSQAGVPKQMLRAEELLASAEAAPQEEQRRKLAERALRLYYHAKWLAERNHATAAGWRYREASRLALQTRRKVLAAHALGRFGYFLIHWNRHREAKEVLQESRRLSAKSNPLAPYLLGVLERQDAGADVERIRYAEELIISGGEQPSADLEADRQQMMRTIYYWRDAETSVWNCFATADAAYMAICFFGHLFQRQALG